MNEKIREEFEKWILDTTAWQKANMYEDKNDKNKYGFNVIQKLWEAWQAGYKQACNTLHGITVELNKRPIPKIEE